MTCAHKFIRKAIFLKQLLCVIITGYGAISRTYLLNIEKARSRDQFILTIWLFLNTHVRTWLVR